VRKQLSKTEQITHTQQFELAPRAQRVVTWTDEEKEKLLRLISLIYPPNHARWSATIHAEWTRNLAKDRPELAAKLPLVVERMNASDQAAALRH
jgi:hypothetical protein